MAGALLTGMVAGGDRLLALPKDVIEEILSYVVEEKAGAGASCLSSMKYNEEDYKKSFPGRNDFCHRVIRSLKRCREKNISIENLELIFVDILPGDNEWIQLVKDTGVKHLRVWAFDVLPPMIFEVESLESLTVDYLEVPKVPESIKFCNLKYLDFVCATLDQENLDSIFSACKNIETLQFWKCYGFFQNLKVTNLLNLKHFVFHGLLDESPPSIQIEAQNVKQLELHEVNIPAGYEDDLGSRFPGLEHFDIHRTCDDSECVNRLVEK